MNNSLKKVLANHVYFDLNFIIYHCVIELEEEVNSILKIIYNLPFNYNNNDIEKKIESILDLKVYVSCEENFDGISRLADRASSIFIEKLGEKGKHPRSVLGVTRLPQNAPVMIDLRASLKP